MNTKAIILLITLPLLFFTAACGKGDSSTSKSVETETSYRQIDPQGNILKYIEPPDTIPDIELVILEHDYSGGSAALATILNYTFDLNLSEVETIEGMMTYGNQEQIQRLKAFSLYDMQQYVNALGYTSNGYNYDGLCNTELDELSEISGSALIPVEIDNYRHFVILLGYDETYIYLASPSYGKICVDRQDICIVEYKAIIFIVWPDGITPESKGQHLLPASLKRFL